jgi:alpha-tubulin suppressor-like RCC1 family protein
MNTGSGITRLDYIQSYDFSFNVERNPLKQIGSDSFATRQTQFAPDVNLNIQYYLNDGWNDKFIGLDISPDGSGNPFDTILSSTGDRNFYVSIAQNDGIDQNLKTGIVNSNVLGIGNCYITNYEISVSVNELATVSCSFVGGNANVQDYATSKYLPSVNALSSGQNAEDANKNFALNFISNARTEEYFSKAKDNFTGGCPYSKCKITPDFQSSATTSPLTFGFFDAVANNFQSMQFSVQFDRKPLYGFGSNHPYTRKVQRPIAATLALSALIDDFQAENLSKIFHKEGGAKSSILIEFFNFSDVKKFGLALDNLTLESYSLGARIGGRVLVETNWTVEIINGSESNVKMIGSYAQRALDSILVNESFAVENLFVDMSDLYGLSKDFNLWTVFGISEEADNTPIRNPINISKRSLIRLADNFGRYDGAYAGIDKNGKVWTWGPNTKGMIGDNSTVSKSTPVSVYGSKTFCKISKGDGRFLAIDKYGKAWTWGSNGLAYNNNFGLGDGSTLSRRTPVSIYGSKTFCEVAAGGSFAVGVDKYGKAWAWGEGGNGQLGINSQFGKLTPFAVHGNKTFCKIKASGLTCAAIDKYGKVWAWGWNLNYGGGGIFPAGAPTYVLTPIALFQNKTFCEINIYNSDSAFLIDRNGKGWAEGVGYLGNNLNSSSSSPVAICGNHTFCKIYPVYSDLIRAIDNRQRSWTWGLNHGINDIYGFGRLGNGPEYFPYYKTPTKLPQFNNKNFVKLGFGIGLDIRGKVWGWGRNDTGQIGDNSTTFRNSPVVIGGSLKTFCKITNYVGYNRGTSAAIDKYGQVWCWGSNMRAQLGNGTSPEEWSGVFSVKTPVSLGGAKKTFCDIKGGGEDFFIALDKYGKGWGWGGDDYGQIGNGGFTEYRSTPVAVYGNKTFCKIAAGGNFTIAIDKSGKAWGWGYCAYGTLGIGDIPFSEYGEPLFREILTPIAVCGNKTFCEISCEGAGTTLAIDKHGKVWAWGDNFFGTAGNGQVYTNIYSPVSLAGAAKTFCKISTSGGSFAVDKDSKLWGWGFNVAKSLGINTSIVSICTPTAVCSGKNYSKAEGGFLFETNNNIFSVGIKHKFGASINSVLTPVRIYGF